jgi:hypothetical protein
MPTATFTTIYTDRVLQDGIYSLGAWFELGDLVPLGAPHGIGIIFDLSGIQNMFIPESVTFRIFQGGSATGITSSVYVIDEASPEDYSTTLFPGGRGETLLVSEVTGDFRTGDLTWPSLGGTEFTYYFGQRNTSGTWAADTTLAANWTSFVNRRLRRADWSGRLALSLVSDDPGAGVPYYHSSEDTVEGRRPTITNTEWRSNTGHAVGGFGRRSKAVYCARSGLPLQSDQMVEDQHIPGLWVHPDWYEPEDRMGENIRISGSEREDDGRYGEDG